MARLAYFALFTAILAYAAGCTRTSLTYVGDGGTVCTELSPTECAADSRCEQHIGCCNDFECVPKGTLFAPCPLAPASACTQQCSGLNEQTCSATPGCRADYCSECSCTPVFVGCTRTVDPPTTCPLLGCPALQCQCDGLDEQSCIANETSLGCTPYYCPNCGVGDRTFRQCLGPNEGAPACNASCTQQTCRSASDCNGVCVAPGAPLCGGACPIGCMTDTDCSGGSLCQPATCTCGTSGMTCQPPCNANSCTTGEVCLADGHCAPTPCSSTKQCPTWFECVFPPSGGASPHCQRQACTADGDCGAGGYCVDGGCYGSLGTCEIPPPGAGGNG